MNYQKFMEGRSNYILTPWINLQAHQFPKKAWVAITPTFHGFVVTILKEKTALDQVFRDSCWVMMPGKRIAVTKF